MSGKHVTFQQYRLYMGYRKVGDTQIKAAAKIDISLSAAKRVEKDGLDEYIRNYKTRIDPFEKIWTEVEELLKEKPTLSAITILEFFQEKYPGKYPDNLLRSMQRKVKHWKAVNGSEKEVMFTQKHIPGLLGLSDFTVLKGVQIKNNYNNIFGFCLYFLFTYWSSQTFSFLLF